MTPQRIQRRMTKGFRLPPNTICVSRPNRWGNPFKVGRCLTGDLAYRMNDGYIGYRGLQVKTVITLDVSLGLYRFWLEQQLESGALDLDDLRDADYLACWCALDRPCHVDVILELLEERT